MMIGKLMSVTAALASLSLPCIASLLLHHLFHLFYSPRVGDGEGEALYIAPLLHLIIMFFALDLFFSL